MPKGKCGSRQGQRRRTFEDTAHLSECSIFSTRQYLDGGFEITDLIDQGVSETVDFQRPYVEEEETYSLLLPETKLALSYAVLITSGSLRATR